MASLFHFKLARPIAAWLLVAIAILVVASPAASSAADHATAVWSPPPAPRATPRVASNVELLSMLTDNYSGVVISDTLAYVGFDVSGEHSPRIAVLNISNPAAPSLVTTYLIPTTYSGGYIRPLDIIGTRLAVKTSDGVVVLDLSVNPPTALGPFNIVGDVAGARIRNNLLYAVSSYNGAFYIFDLTRPPASAQRFKSGALEGVAVEVVGTTAYVAHGRGIRIYNTSNPDAPVLLGSHAITFFGTAFQLVGNVAFIAQSLDFEDGKLDVVNVSNPAQPTLITQLDIGSLTYSMAKNNTYLYLTSMRALHILNVSNPLTPRIAYSYNGDRSIYIAAQADLIYGASNNFTVLRPTLTQSPPVYLPLVGR